MLKASKAEKDARKQAAQQRKSDIEAGREAAKLLAKYCPATVTGFWGVTGDYPCQIRVSVTGFAPGTYQVDTGILLA